MHPPPHVLHIDADQQARAVLSSAFAASGIPDAMHSLSTASNALLYLNGLGPFKGFPRPQLIIIDLDLPRSDGADFLHMLRTNTRFKAIGICVLMTFLTEANIQRCQALGVERYRLKPYAPPEAGELVALVKTWLQGSPPEGMRTS
jgi:CheY-like chemotaxis protein